MTLESFIKKIPKAELHLHIEGSFEPELMFKIAKRNNIPLKYSKIEDLKKAYNFNNLQEFLDIYYAGANVLITEQDFYDLTWAYLVKINQQNVKHTEIFFDPQTHTGRGISFDTVIKGILKALKDGKEKLGISSKLILSFLRHLDQADALHTLQTALPYKTDIIAVGLDSSELGNPPYKFKKTFQKAANEGFLAVAHAGEEGPSEYVWSALQDLNVKRIDHGNKALDDPELVQFLVKKKIPLTVCPLSNFKLKVVKDLKKHPLKTMIDLGLKVTVNSDDPAYFGGYMTENLLTMANALNLTKEDIYKLCRNAFEGSFLSQTEKNKMIKDLDAFYLKNK